jgi:PilZ domain
MSQQLQSHPSFVGRDVGPVRAPGCLPFRAAVSAAGMDLEGHTFLTNCHTEVITSSGCSILLKQALSADSEIDLRIGDREVHGRIAGIIRTCKQGHVYAVEFDPPGSFEWDTSFPDAPGPAPTVALHCQTCDLSDDVPLVGLDALVFQAAGAITRACARCRRRTRWGRERGTSPQPPKGPLRPSSGPAATEPDAALPIAAPINPSAASPGKKDQRKSARVQLKGAKACLETPVRGTDVVAVINISKGGLRFVSGKNYELGDWMKVSVPYTPGGNNIFVAAEIVRVVRAAGNGVPGEYALKFRPV